MKTRFNLWFSALVFLALSTINSQLSTVHAQGTAFTYQGRLNSGGAPANGSYDIAFSLFATNTSGVAIAGPVTNAAVAVSNGLFTTAVDFGSVFTGGSNWLEIAVSTNGANGFFTLAPRQQLTPVPYAITAANVSGTIASASLAGNYGNAVIFSNANNSFAGNGAGLTSLNTSNLVGVINSNQLAPNIGVWTRSGSNLFYNAGNVGIGTSTPTENMTIGGVANYNTGLKVTGSNASGTGLAIENTASGGHKYDLISAGAGSGEGAGAFELYDETVFDGFRLTITTNGNVGIGTFTPTTALQVNGVVKANSFSGSAGGLTGLSATAITGTVADANLSANVALLNRSTQSFTGGVNTFSGNVGIGTTTPTKALLEVEGNVANVDQGAFEYYNITGTPAHATGSPTGQNYSIWASDRIAGSEFNAYSDARIKNIEGQSDAAADLKTLVGIKITDYTYKDTIVNGNRSVKKVIAQQVEQVYPQAVSKSIGEVPDIYKLATIKDGWIQLVTDLKVGDRVKLIGEKEQGIYPVLAVGDGAFRTDFKPDAKKVFVYGRQVKDFRSVDYEAIAMLNVSATQELARKLEDKDTKINELEARLEKLEQMMSVKIAEAK